MASLHGNRGRRGSLGALAAASLLAITTLSGLTDTARATVSGAAGQIAFMSDRSGSADIWVMEPDGSQPTQLTFDPSQDSEPSFSPDGQRIAFTSHRDGNAEIYLINADGTGETRLTFSPGFDQQPAFSPDGRRIAFASTRGEFGISEVYVMNVDGSGVTQLTASGWPSGQPAWSPDGGSIAYIKNIFGQVDIFLTGNTTTCCTRAGTQLTDTLGPDLVPTFSPDGGTIAFVSNRDGNFEIYTMDTSGANETRLTNHVASDNLPSFSPDGLRIAFESTRVGALRQIYTMARDGTDVTPVTAGPYVGAWPDWGVSATDATAPTISCDTPDAAWHPADVSLACTASDLDSGLADPADAAFTLSTTVPAGSEDANASTGTRQVCDGDGNCATAGPITGIMVDKLGPSVTIVKPEAATYLLNQPVAADYTCADAGSGLASCSGPVVDGAAIDTASVGTSTFTVNATDNVANGASDAVTYDVAYAVSLSYDPAKPTKKVRLQLHDANGANVSSAGTVLTVVSIDGSEPVSGTFAFNNGRYIYAVATDGLATGLHTLEFKASGDATLHSAPFQVK